MKKKHLTFAATAASAPVMILKGKRRESVNPGLSEKAVTMIRRYEVASQQSMQRLSTIRLV